MASQYDLPYTGPQVETLLAKISELESEMPSKTSDLTNDSGFVTSADVPTKTSDLNNDSGFITNAPVAAEAARAQAAEALLATISSLQAEISRATGVEGTLQNLIDGIAAKIPSAATEQNQLADKAFVNSSIATATAEFRGTYDSLAELQAVSADENDYGYVRTTDAAGNTIFKRYKYASGSWVFEYDLNNSSFTASQWAAINSAITAELVEKLRNLPTNAALTELLNGKQGVIPDLDTIRANAAAGGTAYQKPAGGIPKSDMSSEVQSSLGKADSAVQDVSGKADKTELEALAEEVAKKANTDGYYGGMTVGSAENLVGRGSVDAEYAGIRTSAGSADIGSGSASVVRMKGNSFKWNQLVQNGNFADGATGWVGVASVSNGVARGTRSAEVSAVYRDINYNYNIPVIKGHKYLYLVECLSNNSGTKCSIRATNTSSDGFSTNIYFDKWTRFSWIWTAVVDYTQPRVRGDNGESPTTDVDFSIKNFNIFDLSAIFGPGNEPSTIEEFDAWREEKGLTLDYYEYNPGEVINNRAAAIETVGFNRYNPATGKAFLPGKYSDYPQEYEICGEFSSISYTDINGNESVPTLTDGRFFNVDAPGELTVVGGNATDTLVHLVWSGWRNQGEPDYAFEPYWKNTLNLNLTTLTGKLNGAGESVVVFPNGPAKIGDVQDEIVGNKATKRIGVVDMGTLNWTAATQENTFYANVQDIAPIPSLSTVPELCCHLYSATSRNNQTANNTNKTIAQGASGAAIRRIFIIDTSYTDAATFEAAMSGVLLYFELATPEEYILDTTPEWNYRVDDFGTERVIPSYDASNLTAPIAYDVQYAMNAVDAIRRLDTNYVRRDNVKQTAGRSETDVLSQKGVDDNYAKKVGVENDLVVGAAKALAGNQRQVKEFTTMVMDGADGIAKINDVKGKSLVWNQVVMRSLNDTLSGLTFSTDANNIIHINGTATASYVNPFRTMYGGDAKALSSCPLGVYYMHVNIINNPDALTLEIRALNSRINFVYSTSDRTKSYSARGVCSDLTRGPSLGLIAYGGSGTVFNDVQIQVSLIDLTLMFGGNEPSTVEEFEAMFPLPYYAYNEGEIISNKTEQVKVVGFNQWDEEWELGIISGTTGNNVADNSYIRSKNYCRCLPGTSYYARIPSPYTIRMYWYDANKNFISAENWQASTSYVTPANCFYFRFVSWSIAYGNTYKNDICINLSDPSFNGTYEPYKHADIPLNLSTITGKLNGEGESVVIFPNGMRSAGSAYDYLIVDEDGYARRAVKVMGSVDMGTLGWQKSQDNMFYSPMMSLKPPVSTAASRNSGIICSKYTPDNVVGYSYANSGDKTIKRAEYGEAKAAVWVKDSSYVDSTTADFKAAISGKELVYELATPLEYVLDEPIPMTFMAYHGGTMTQTPQAPDSAPMVINVTFAIDAVSTLIGLPEDYVSKASLQAMLSQMQSAGIIGSYTMTYNATAGRYDFTFTKPTTE